MMSFLKEVALGNVRLVVGRCRGNSMGLYNYGSSKCEWSGPSRFVTQFMAGILDPKSYALLTN